VEDFKWETIFYGHYRFVFNNYDVIGQQSNRIPRENAKSRLLCRSRSFKVIKVGINRKPVCDFLLVIVTDILSRAVRSLLFKFWTLCIFEPLFERLRDNVRCPSLAHWKAHSGLLSSVN